MGVRHGVAVFGESGSMKSTLINAVAKVTEREVIRINLRALTMNQFYGFYDEQNKEWKDGVFTKAMRKQSDKPLMIVLEDNGAKGIQNFIELFNTLLDDNKKLCIANGEMIDLLPNTKIVFEIPNADHCTPAFVSRLGCVTL